jgi:AcrR family transcriptional regulator
MPPAGRPRTFDREEALRKAMLVFWEKGYEGTTMTDLISTIGMKAPSVYAAFGSKDALFREVVELYSHIVGQGPLKALNASASIYSALENLLKENVEMLSGSNNPSSCLIMTAAINCAPEHREHVEHLKNLRSSYKATLEARFNQALADGQLIEAASPQALAEFYTGFIHGLALRARDGSSKKELRESCDFALQALRSVLSGVV